MRRVSVSLMAVSMAFLSASVSAQVPTPTIEGPIAGPGVPFVAGTTFDLAEVGYTQDEYFISGTATAYTSAVALTSDGLWTVTPGDTAAYKTRILVYRPIKPSKFRGSVVVEWLNVSGGLDSAADWITAHTEMIRSGMIWVGVSAQFVGVEGGGGAVISLPLKDVNPARYGTLEHPGDSFSYDMFSQAGQALRASSGTNVLGGRKIKRLLAAGESQSAFRLTTYVNAIHPVAGIYDGYLIHSRAGTGVALSQSPQASIGAPNPTLIRTDIDVPVLTFQTESDLIFLDSVASRQPDTDNIRLWEVAGTAHADTYTLVTGMGDLGDSPDVVEIVITSTPIPGVIECDLPINSGPQHFVLNAALASLDRWVRRGKPPAEAPRLAIGAGPSLVLDSLGNALGGIRTPWVDAPIATLSGLGQTGGGLCFLFGTTELLDPATLTALYSTELDFIDTHRTATRQAVRKRHILRKDAKLMRKWAASSGIGG